MTTRRGIKITVFFVFCIAMMSGFALFVLEGSFFVERIGVKKMEREFVKNRGVALQSSEEEIFAKVPEDAANIKMISFTLHSKDPNGYFRSGSPLSFKCVLKNEGKKESVNFRSLIRTPKGEITSVKTKLLKPGEKITLEGTYTGTEPGILIAACRGDIDAAVVETNENDNREIAVSYLLP